MMMTCLRLRSFVHVGRHVNLNDIFYETDEEIVGNSSSGARTKILIKG
jgi:hypothetical protein